MKQEKAMGRTKVISASHVGQDGPGEATGNGAHNADASVLPMEGRAGRSIIPITASKAPGKRGATMSKPTMMTKTARAMN
jgi:hypothetical protein